MSTRPRDRYREFDDKLFEFLKAEGQLPGECRDFAIIAKMNKPVRIVVDYFPTAQGGDDGQDQR